MPFIPRAIEKTLRTAAHAFSAVVLTGPRRAGKTTVFRRLFPRARYVLLEDSDAVARARSDPHGFLDDAGDSAILDEIQNVPELFPYIRARIDQSPKRRYLITGSHDVSLMKGVTESMAGRAAVLQLLPFSASEMPRVSLLSGGFPESVLRPKSRELWFSSYVQTYLERDVRSIADIRDLATFRRFLTLVASRHGQILNKSDLASPLGVSVPTIGHWLSVLEVTGQIILVPPYFENFGKRLLKSPKLYIVDSGLACHLLGLRSTSELARSPFAGSVFEGAVAGEILKAQLNSGARREIYYFRDQQGLEVDFLVPAGGGQMNLIECSSTKTVQPAMARPLLSLRSAMGDRAAKALIVHAGSTVGAVAPGVRAVDFNRWSAAL